MVQTFSLPSFAKINWTLRVAGKRPDGYHELCTLFQTISLNDTLHFESSQGIELTCDDPSVVTGDRNLILMAAHRLRSAAGVRFGASMYLEKRIPSPGGLGGGSSNAATALIGLSRLWGLKNAEDLNRIASVLGSDVAFFLHGGTAVGTGRGEKIEAMGDVSADHMVVVTPNIGVSTNNVFDSLNAPFLTTQDQNHILSVCRNDLESFDPVRSALINDLEPTVFRTWPEVERAKSRLLDLGARNAAMSGSGASVFAVFDNTEARQAALKALDAESTWRKFAVSTVSRSAYRAALQI